MGKPFCKNETNYVQQENMEMEMRGGGLVGRSVGWLSFDLLLLTVEFEKCWTGLDGSL